VRRITGQLQCLVLQDFAHDRPVERAPALPLDLRPFLVGHERCPLTLLGGLVRPLQQVYELGPAVRFAFPRRHDIEAVAFHDAQCVVAEAPVEGLPVPIHHLVDAELVDRSLSSLHGARIGGAR
jgi:hypothetical protein